MENPHVPSKINILNDYNNLKTNLRQKLGQTQDSLLYRYLP